MDKTYKITLTGLFDNELKKELVKLQELHKEKVQGIYDLYNSLYVNQSVETYSKARAYYLAYTLADNDIEFTIE